MNASKASSSASKGQIDETAATEDEGPGLKVVTFRLTQEHKDRLAAYSIELSRLQDPQRQVSANQAIQHMIMNAPLPTKKNGKLEVVGKR
jgi:hypothetical protein